MCSPFLFENCLNGGNEGKIKIESRNRWSRQGTKCRRYKSWNKLIKWHQLIINRPLKNSNMKLVNKIFHSSLFDKNILRYIFGKIIQNTKIAVPFRRSDCRGCRWHLQVAPSHRHRPPVGCPQRRRQLPLEVSRNNWKQKLMRRQFNI